LQTSHQSLAKIPFAYKRASAPACGETGCPVYEQLAGQIAVLIGSGAFSVLRRLTGFREAGKIIRIRTNTATARDAIC
jgi:hypothetical protein